VKTPASSSSKVEFSEYAARYVAARQRVSRRTDINWLEVATAYDAGINHAFAVTPQKRAQMMRYFRALLVINAARRQERDR